MAKGKLPPRQKMINLMYLIFIAMMAMQIDREVLRSFEGINTSLVDAADLTRDNNNTFYDQIDNKAQEDAEYRAIQEQANRVKAESDAVYAELQKSKDELIAAAEYTPPAEGQETKYVALQNSDVVTNLFFTADNDSPRGQELQAAVKRYADFLNTQYTQEVDRTRVQKLFSTEQEGTRSWLNRVFYNQPMVAAMTNLSKIQSDVRTEEGNLVRSLLAEKLQDEIELKAFQPIVDFPTIVKVGDKVQANVAFGAYDNSLQGSVNVGGSSVPLTGGKATFAVNTSSPGTKTISGTMSYRKPDGTTESMPFSRTYTVVSETLEKAPVGGSISADNMNVVYRGVANPLTATINGADGPVSMTASTGNLSGSNGKYTFTVAGGNSVTFTASAKTSTGGTVTERKEFRIKPVPPPQGQIRGRNALTVPASSLSALAVEAAIPDFEFPVSFTVTSFKVKVSGQRTVNVNGNRLSAAGRVLDQVKAGDAVNVFDIEVTASGMGGAQIRNVTPVTIEVQ
ncbi:MAG: gliding motility protein GldM [Weeksellaceae bacterium]|nr:gliding motility protein GldM [Weeksellaceae bacterium]